MSRRPAIAESGQPPLYVTDEQLWPMISPQLSRAAFIKGLLELETRGFPKFDPVFKGRYWPAVRAWLDRRAGIGRHEIMAADGEETWDGETKRVPGADHAQARRLGKTILERRQPNGQSGPISKPIDPFTERRHRGGNS
jgi:hypothetical protein